MENSEAIHFHDHQRTTTAKQSVLVIDDNPDMLTLQRAVLELGGYEVCTVPSGAKAFEILSKIDMPALILLDVQMEDMSGPEFLLKLEEKMPEIIESVPVVFLTGLDKVPESRAVGIIHKSIDVDRFLEAVQQYIGMANPTAYKH